MTTDQEYLQQYVVERSEAAFRALVERYMGLVYGACARQLGDRHAAEDAAQAVFLILSEKAATVRASRLAGWLLSVARFACADVRRSRARREMREIMAAKQESITDKGQMEMLELVDVALRRLGKADREAVVRRCMQGQSLIEVGAALGVSEDAARKRVERGVDKLRKFFARRGLVAGAATITTALGTQATQALAGEALGGMIERAVMISQGGGASAAPAAIARGAKMMMRAARWKTVAAAGLVMLAGIAGWSGWIAASGRPHAAAQPELKAIAAPANPGNLEHKLVINATPDDAAWCVAVAPDGKRIATTGGGGSRIFDAATGKLLRTIPGIGHRQIVFTPDSKHFTLAGFAMDKLVRLWSADTGEVVRTFQGHAVIETYAAAISPDGKLLASAGTDKTLLIWNLENGALVHRITDMASPLSALAFSPDSSTLAGGGGDRLVYLWNTQTGQRGNALAGHTGWIDTLAFSVDGKILASGSCNWNYHRGRDPNRFSGREGREPINNSEWRLWEIPSGTLLRKQQEQGEVLSMALSRDARWLVCGSGNEVRAYDLHENAAARSLAHHDAMVTYVAFTPDGAAILTAAHDRILRRIAFASGEMTWQVAGSWEQVQSVASSDDGALIATATCDARFMERVPNIDPRILQRGAVRLWDGRTGQFLRKLGDPAEQITSVALSHDGRFVACGAVDRDGGGVVRMWESATGAAMWTMKDHAGEVLAVAFAPQGAALASASADGTVKLRDPASGAVLQTLAGHERGATSVAYSGDGATLTAGAGDGSVFLWDIHSGAILRSFAHARRQDLLAPGARFMSAVALSRDGAVLVSSTRAIPLALDQKHVKIWNARTGELQHEFSGWPAALSPDGTLVATGGKSVYLWDIRSGQEIRKMDPDGAGRLQSVAFSSDGQHLVSASTDGPVAVWDAATGGLICSIMPFVEANTGRGDEHWVTWTPGGFYTGSAGVDEFLSWMSADSTQSNGRPPEGFNRPEEVEKALRPGR